MIVVHPGFGRSGTTTLQDCLFGRHPALVRLGRPYANRREREAVARLYMDDITYDAGQLPFDPIDSGLVRVFSEELLTANHVRVGRAEIARRLHELWPSASILFTIRNQVHAVQSSYVSHFVRTPPPYWGGPVSLGRWLKHELQRGLGGALGSFDYWPVISKYMDLFGRGNVTVLVAEQLFHQPAVFAGLLSPVLRMDAAEILRTLDKQHANRRQSIFGLLYHQARAAIPWPGHLLPPAVSGAMRRFLVSHGPPATPRVPKHLIGPLRDIYAVGNRRLAEEFNLPLLSLGYPG